MACSRLESNQEGVYIPRRKEKYCLDFMNNSKIEKAKDTPLYEDMASEQRQAGNLMSAAVAEAVKPGFDFNTSLDPEAAGPKHDIVHPSRANDGELSEKAELARKEGNRSLTAGHAGLINHGNNQGFFSHDSGHVQSDGRRKAAEATSEPPKMAGGRASDQTGFKKSVKAASDRKKSGD